MAPAAPPAPFTSPVLPTYLQPAGSTTTAGISVKGFTAVPRTPWGFTVAWASKGWVKGSNNETSCCKLAFTGSLMMEPKTPGVGSSGIPAGKAIRTCWPKTSQRSFIALSIRASSAICLLTTLGGVAGILGHILSCSVGGALAALAEGCLDTSAPGPPGVRRSISGSYSSLTNLVFVSEKLTHFCMKSVCF
eukprot:Skav235566  [mRNA]  locus=scaffold3067:404251:406135:+ [translate_table: standard]